MDIKKVNNSDSTQTTSIKPPRPLRFLPTSTFDPKKRPPIPAKPTTPLPFQKDSISSYKVEEKPVVPNKLQELKDLFKNFNPITCSHEERITEIAEQINKDHLAGHYGDCNQTLKHAIENLSKQMQNASYISKLRLNLSAIKKALPLTGSFEEPQQRKGSWTDKIPFRKNSAQ